MCNFAGMRSFLCVHAQFMRTCKLIVTGLGFPSITTHAYKCPECYKQADIYGDHQVGCGGSADRIGCHNAIREVIFNAAQSATLAPFKEALIRPRSHYVCV